MIDECGEVDVRHGWYILNWLRCDVTATVSAFHRQQTQCCWNLQLPVGKFVSMFLESNSVMFLYMSPLGIEALRGVYHVDIPVICYSLAEGMHATFMWFGLSLLRDV